MLNLAAPLESHTHPYSWAVVDDFLSADDRTRLRAALPPLDDFNRAERTTSGDKRYGMYVLPLVEKGTRLPALERVDRSWRDLVESVDTAAYRTWVERAVGAEVGNSTLDIGIFLFGVGDGVTPHTDKSDKAATHVLYLNDGWPDTGGGEFEIRAQGELEVAPASAILPSNGKSVVFAQSASSWHAAAPVTDQAQGLRMTVQVEMWR